MKIYHLQDCIAKRLPKLSSRRPSVILLNASGVKIVGEGEWTAERKAMQKSGALVHRIGENV